MSNEIKKAEERKLPRVRPASDILQREDGFYIYLDMPGVSKEEVVLDLRQEELIVSGRTRYLAGDQEKYLEVEFGDGEYRRSFTLSDSVDREKIKAGFTNGVLEIFLPKAEKAHPKRIEIQAG